MKHLRLFGLVLAFVLALCMLVKGQERIISRVVNVHRIARAWNSLGPSTKEWNDAMERADALIHERFNPKLIVADPEAKQRETVIQYKAAKEALLKQLDALNELIDEEDQ
jgi:C4-type Zn-finger protein